MDYSTDSGSGQHHSAIIQTSLLVQIKQQCETFQMLRGWYAHFDDSIRLIDRAASIKAHDLITDGVINARQIARELGFPLPDVSKVSWDLSPAPASFVQEL